MNMRRGRRCPCPTACGRGHDATTAMAGGRTAIEACRMGWSDLSADAPRAKAEAISIAPAHAVDGFRFRATHPARLPGSQSGLSAFPKMELTRRCAV